MKYILSKKYSSPELMAKIMGPNPIKLEEELLCNGRIPRGATVCDLGSGQGLTSVFMVKEYGFVFMLPTFGAIPRRTAYFLEAWVLAMTR